MSKVITFSRVFPSYHPKAGQPTYFVEKIYNFLFGHFGIVISFTKLCELNPDVPRDVLFAFHTSIERSNSDIKNHTIRGGHRWKAGDLFSPRVWSGVPYNSKQIIIADDIKIPKIWDIKMIIEGYKEFFVSGKSRTGSRLCLIAMNDGLTTDDLHWWFTKPFEGQIICWNETVEY